MVGTSTPSPLPRTVVRRPWAAAALALAVLSLAAPHSAADTYALAVGPPGMEPIMKVCVYYDPEPDVGASTENQAMVWVYFVGFEEEGGLLPPEVEIPEMALGLGSEHAGASWDCPEGNLVPENDPSDAVDTPNDPLDRLPVDPRDRLP